MSRYSGTDLAPYWRFRPTWRGDFHEATFTGDIMFCNWTCDRCWSKFGMRTVTPRYELDPVEAAEKLAAGVRRNGSDAARITGGEPALYWDHVVALVEAYCERSDAPIEIETSGAILAPEQLDRLVGIGPAQSVLVVFGLKSTTPEGLAKLTGLPIEVARRNHQRQLDAAMYASRLPIRAAATLLDAFTDEGMFAALSRELEAVTLVRWINVQASRYYKPKRHRR